VQCSLGWVRKALRQTGLAAQYLELELTESLLLSNADVMFSVFRELKAMGLRLAVDDFGIGYSSLSYLKQFPVCKLKIDRSFVRDVATSADDAAITTAIISLAKSLNLKVIAEGVENEAQMSFLRAHSCDEFKDSTSASPYRPPMLSKSCEERRPNSPDRQATEEDKDRTSVTASMGAVGQWGITMSFF
jgi:EAL domain-containing protein (putative c-di-GMP-specific phosphodiesterase class I)